MTIRKLTEILKRERQDGVIGDEDVLEYVNALETRLCTEVFLTHEDPPPGVYMFMGLPLPGTKPGTWPPPLPPHPPGYHEEWLPEDYRDIELLAKPPYDDVYRAYIQYRCDLAQNETINADNSQRIYWRAFNDFAKYWHRTHMPINKTPYHGYKE